jgi:Flp pilus assembly pilin Flp
MTKVLAATGAFVRGEERVSLVEYALTLLLLPIVTIAAISEFGSRLSTFFSDLAGSL